MSIKTYTLKALASAEAYADAINQLRALCAKLDYDTARAEILPVVAARYKVAVIEGKGKATGKLTLDREAAGFEAAKKAITRLLADIYETPKAEQKSMRLSAEVRKLAEAYLANFDNVAQAVAALRHVAK